jgi:ribosomal protein S19
MVQRILIFRNTLNSIACGPLDKPAPVKTHLRNMIIVPEMVGSTIAIYNGKVFNLVDIKADMVGNYLGEFSISYRFAINNFLYNVVSHQVFRLSVFAPCFMSVSLHKCDFLS